MTAGLSKAAEGSAGTSQGGRNRKERTFVELRQFKGGTTGKTSKKSRAICIRNQHYRRETSERRTEKGLGIEE